MTRSLEKLLVFLHKRRMRSLCLVALEIRFLVCLQAEQIQRSMFDYIGVDRRFFRSLRKTSDRIDLFLVLNGEFRDHADHFPLRRQRYGMRDKNVAVSVGNCFAAAAQIAVILTQRR